MQIKVRLFQKKVEDLFLKTLNTTKTNNKQIMTTSQICLLQSLNPFETSFSLILRLAGFKPVFRMTDRTHLVSSGCVSLQVIVPTVHVIQQSVYALCVRISCPQRELYSATFFHNLYCIQINKNNKNLV